MSMVPSITRGRMQRSATSKREWFAPKTGCNMKKTRKKCKERKNYNSYYVFQHCLVEEIQLRNFCESDALSKMWDANMKKLEKTMKNKENKKEQKKISEKKNSKQL